MSKAKLNFDKTPNIRVELYIIVVINTIINKEFSLVLGVFYLGVVSLSVVRDFFIILPDLHYHTQSVELMVVGAIGLVFGLSTVTSLLMVA